MPKGGLRQGAGRKKDLPSVTTSIRVKEHVLIACRKSLGDDTLNHKITEFLTSLAASNQ